MVERPRVAICGIHIESSTFSPHHATVADYVGIFHARALPGGDTFENCLRAALDSSAPVLHLRLE